MIKKRAFTLTELLVVVVVIGTLSAVVLPKFTKVLETRRTTEAEQLMAAVRNEQEARCTLDKNYTAVKEKLASWPKSLGNNYSYELTASGISATSDKGYTLAIQSYRKGEICCSGDYCSKLNKSYPECSNEVVNTGCEASDLPDTPEENGCSDDHQEGDIVSTTPCACGTNKYTRWTCDSTNTWVTYEDASSCRDTTTEQDVCENETGGIWDEQNCKCDPPSSTCDESFHQDCEQGGQGAQGWDWVAGTWDTSIGSGNCCVCPDGYHFEQGAGCVKAPACDESFRQDCEQGGQEKSKYVNWVAGTWNSNATDGNCCQCPAGYHYVEDAGCVNCESCDSKYGAAFVAGLRQSCETGLGPAGEKEQNLHGCGFPGTWNPCTCQCECGEGYYFSRTYQVCCDVRGGAQEDRDGCSGGLGESDGHCDYWDQQEWDNYDDMIDSWDGWDDDMDDGYYD